MKVKLFEVRDYATFIPVMCIKMVSSNDQEQYLLSRLGFGPHTHLIQLIWIINQRTEYDPSKWNDRTMYQAHTYITDMWDDLTTGDVVDVSYILGETDRIKNSERYGEIWRQ